MAGATMAASMDGTRLHERTLRDLAAGRESLASMMYRPIDDRHARRRHVEPGDSTIVALYPVEVVPGVFEED